MGCLNIVVNKASPSLDVLVHNISQNLDVAATDIGTHLNLSCGIVCNINDKEYVIRFEKATLLWNLDDNFEGATKYNTLIASGQWSLEEIEIEELL